jgi:hypothetical protein
MGGLLRALRTDLASTSGLVYRLEKAGYVSRQREEGEQRVVHVDRTAKARVLESSLGPVPACLAGRLELDTDRAHHLLQELHGPRDVITTTGKQHHEHQAPLHHRGPRHRRRTERTRVGHRVPARVRRVEV